MSKSKGNVVDPFDQLNRFGVEPVRYFLLKEGTLHQDKGDACTVHVRNHSYLTKVVELICHNNFPSIVTGQASFIEGGMACATLLLYVYSFSYLYIAPTTNFPNCVAPF